MHKFIGFKLIEIKNIAPVSFNSSKGKLKFDHGLFPSDPHPYIIIDVHSTNDMHQVSMERAKEDNKTLDRSVFDSMQDFIRTDLASVTTSS